MPSANILPLAANKEFFHLRYFALIDSLVFLSCLFPSSLPPLLSLSFPPSHPVTPFSVFFLFLL